MVRCCRMDSMGTGMNRRPHRHSGHRERWRWTSERKTALFKKASKVCSWTRKGCYELCCYFTQNHINLITRGSFRILSSNKELAFPCESCFYCRPQRASYSKKRKLGVWYLRAAFILPLCLAFTSYSTETVKKREISNIEHTWTKGLENDGLSCTGQVGDW